MANFAKKGKLFVIYQGDTTTDKFEQLACNSSFLKNRIAELRETVSPFIPIDPNDPNDEPRIVDVVSPVTLHQREDDSPDKIVDLTTESDDDEEIIEIMEQSPANIPTVIRELTSARNVDKEAASGILPVLLNPDDEDRVHVVGPEETPKRKKNIDRKFFAEKLCKITNDPETKKRIEEKMIAEDTTTHDLFHMLDGSLTNLINYALESNDQANYIGHIHGQLGSLFQDCVRNLTAPGSHTPCANDMFDYIPNWWMGRQNIIHKKVGDLQLEILMESHMFRFEMLQAPPWNMSLLIVTHNVIVLKGTILQVC